MSSNLIHTDGNADTTSNNQHSQHTHASHHTSSTPHIDALTDTHTTSNPPNALHSAPIETLQQLRRRLTPSQITKFERLFHSDSHNNSDPLKLRPVVYTSFDGDQMRYMHWMCYVALTLGYVPINPEAALGSYLLNTSHQGSKIEIMRDCISLELCCDEFWHFDSREAIHSLPEGVLAELIVWQEAHRNQPVRFFPWIQPAATGKYADQLVATQHTSTLAAALERGLPLIDQVEHLDPHMTADIQRNLLTSVRDQGVRPLVFLSHEDTDFKHADWARRTAYQTGFVPLHPDTLMEHFVLNMAFGRTTEADYQAAYTASRCSLINAANEMWIFLKPQLDLSDPHAPLPTKIAQDLYFWRLYKGEQRVRVFTWQSAGVPKYAKARWAITTKEHLEEHGP